MKTVILFLLIALAPATAWSQGSSTTAPISDKERTALDPSRGMIELGRSVASTACANCHGVDGISTAAGVPHLAGQRTVYLHRVLQAYQSRERRSDPMNHAIGFLNDEALLAVAAYYASLSPARPEPSEEPPTELADGFGSDPFHDIRDAMKRCSKCHGEDGNSDASGMPNLTAQDSEYFVKSMLAYVDGGRDHKMMKRLVSGLDEATLEKMGVYYAVQEPARTTTVGEGDSVAGQALATDRCANCHGEDGNAAAADMPSLAGQDARYFRKAMLAYRDGSRRHEPMFEASEDLSDEQIENLATFYAVQEPVRRNVRTPLTTAEWIDRCERCHGIDGNSTDPRFPMLAGQDRSYLSNALQSYIKATRNNSTMHAMSASLSQADIAGIVEHYATREPKSVVYMQLPCDQETD